MKKIIFQDNKKIEIKNRFLSGESINKISKTEKVSNQVISNLLKEFGIDTKRKNDFYRKDKSYDEIYGIELSKIVKQKLKNKKPVVLNEESINKIRYHHLKNKSIIGKDKEVILLYKGGGDALNIGRKYGCSQGVIRKILNKNGITLRPQSYYKIGKHLSRKTEFKKLGLDEKFICEKYTKKSIIKLAKEYNCSANTIYRILKRNNIEIKGNKFFSKNKTFEEIHGEEKAKRLRKELSEKQSGKNNGFYGKKHSRETLKKLEEKIYSKKRGKYKGNISRNELYNLYIINKQGIKKCAKQLNCSIKCINNGLKIYGIKKRTLSESTSGELNHRYGKFGEDSPNYGRKMSEETYKILNKKVYSKNRDKTYEDIYGKYRGDEINKKKSATHQRIPLEKWKNFTSFEPYDLNFNNKLKRAIRNRDNQVCMGCGIHREKLKRAFDVHHIDYDKLNSLPQNLISLCQHCHLKTNANREEWTKFFQSLLNKRYNYNYSEDGKIIIKLNKMEKF